MDHEMLSDLPSAARKLFEYWVTARGDARLPGRSAIDPLRLRQWIGDVSIIDLHDGEKRFWVRLHGTNVSHYIGPGFERRYLEDRIPAALHAVALEPYYRVIAEDLPVYSMIAPGLFTGVFERLERMILPFAGPDCEGTERFLVWVGPSKRNRFACETVYGTAAAEPGDGHDAKNTLRVLHPALSEPVTA